MMKEAGLSVEARPAMPLIDYVSCPELSAGLHRTCRLQSRERSWQVGIEKQKGGKAER